jgi:hypothetical protein
MRRTPRLFPIECPPSTPIKLRIPALSCSSSGKINASQPRAAYVENNITCSFVTFDRGDEGELSWVLVHEPPNDVNLFQRDLYCVEVLG